MTHSVYNFTIKILQLQHIFNIIIDSIVHFVGDVLYNDQLMHGHE